MSKSQKSLAIKRSTKVAIVVAALLLLAWPLTQYAHHQARSALARGNAQTDPAQALVWYQVANTLDSHNGHILQKLAATDIKLGRDDDALRAATRSIAHGAGNAGYVLKSQALLELGRTDEAIATASSQNCEMKNENCQNQLALNYAITNNQTKLSDLIASVGSSQAAQRLDAASHSHLGLAQALYASGLLRSSQRILDKYQVENSQYYLLKARVTLELGQDQKTSLEQGRGLLEKGIALSPERIDLRQLLQSVDQKLGDGTAAAEQGTKIKALEAGKV